MNNLEDNFKSRII